METISTIQLPIGIDIDVLVKNGKIGYTFEYKKQNYGTAVKPKSRKIKDIADACLLLIVNAGEVYKELSKDKPVMFQTAEDTLPYNPLNPNSPDNPITKDELKSYIDKIVKEIAYSAGDTLGVGYEKFTKKIMKTYKI